MSRGAGETFDAVVDRDRCEEDLCRLVVDLLGEGYDEIDSDTPLIESGLLDSVLLQSLISYIEDRYRLLLPPEEVRPEHFHSVREIATTLVRCMNRDAESPGTDTLEILNVLMESYGLERCWIELACGRQHVLRCHGRSPRLVLLSGLGSPASSWGMLMRSLNGQRDAIAIDLAGFGISDPNREGDFSFRTHVESTIELLDRLGGERCVLVGSSAGGMIAAEIARRRPDLCCGLVIISFGRVTDGERWWSTLRDLATDADTFWRRAFFDPPPLSSSLRAKLQETLSSRAYLEFLDDDAVAALDRVFEGVTVPTMFLGGMDDGIVAPEIIEAGAAQVPGARLEWIPRCGHYAQTERSEEVLVYLQHFITRLHDEQTAA